MLKTNLRKIIVGSLLLLTVLVAINYSVLNRLYRVVTLFDKENIVGNFLDMKDFLNYSTVKASSQPYRFATETKDIPVSFAFRGENLDTEDFFRDNRTTGILVLKSGDIVYERYFLGHSESNRHISWSVAKSFVSALFGIAMEEGSIKSVDDLVTDYVPELKNTGYDGIIIKDVLQMATGVGFNEDYGDFFSDINRFGRTIALGASLDDFSASLKKHSDPGQKLHYVSINTQVLGMILTRATGMSLTDYLQEKLWEPLGMEHDAYWITDNQGMELALGGLNATMRDYAKFGQLFANGGVWQGRQIIPQDWYTASVTPDAPHIMPDRRNTGRSTDFGYGYQWWIPGQSDDEFMARGVYNQFIYIDPDAEVVIVNNSANHLYNDRSHHWEEKHISLFRSIVLSLEGSQTISTPALRQQAN